LANEINIKSLAMFCENRHCKYIVFNKFGEKINTPVDYNDKVNLLIPFELVEENENDQEKQI
jgi:hypothetical protein